MQWDLIADQQISGLDAFCKASCIDVTGGVAIGGFSDLRQVPLLAKLRVVRDLTVNVGGLRDLRGLENLDVVGSLHLIATHDAATFTSLDGFGDRQLRSLQLEQLQGLVDLDGTRFDQLDSLWAESTSLQRVDLSTLTMGGVAIREAQISDLKLGGGARSSIGLDGIGPVTSFTWRSDLSARSILINHNEQLSSCLVQDFIAQTATPGAIVIAEGNGPCP